MNIFCHMLETPVGWMTLCENEEGLCRADFGNAPYYGEAVRRQTPLLLRAEAQLLEYFSGSRRIFSLPLSIHGTPFQERCWKALLDIPYGQTRSYGDIARAAGSPKGCRAAGGAIHRNPVSIIIPCHRVIGADGSMTGFGGGLPVKEYLLALEKNNGLHT